MRNNKFTRHIVSEMDGSYIQRCVMCGEIINDYSNSMWPDNQLPPSGYRPGEVFSNGFYTTLEIGKDAEFIDCTNFNTCP